MKFNKIRIQNIRSYQEVEISLEEGITLLSGDVGSGKTSLLMAIEFALFGILRGEVAPDELLRHGTNKGSVELSISTANKEYKIKRQLKRTNNGVVQDTGILTINNIAQDLTATELKAKILELLGYPQEYQTKSKNFIYRFTTYTPQEEVKRILEQADQARIDTIRKIFNIDKYRIAKENATELGKYLRRNIAELQEKILEENELKEETKRLEQEIEEKKRLIQENKIKEVKYSEKKLELEQSLEEWQTKKENYTKQLLEQENIKKSITEYTERINNFDKKKPEEIIKPEVKEYNINSIKEKLLDTNKKLQEVKEKIAITNSKIESINKELEEMNQLDECPTCKQKITEEHKLEHTESSNKEINELNSKLRKYEEYKEKAEKNLNILTETLDSQNKEKQEQDLNLIRYNNYLEQKRSYELAIEEQSNLKKKLEELKTQVKPITEINLEEYNKIKHEHREVTEEINKLRLNIVRTNTEIEYEHKQLEQNKEKLSKINTTKKKIEQKTRLNKWINEYFIKSTSIIESKVLSKINQEFNQHFQNWFNLLLEDESLTARIDENYSPYIIQNGQITQFRNLSGGEKTSMALAYRLSLNQIINEFVSNLQTKKIIILDEPTDGFSSQQLDKLRDVIENLSAKQIIIVSHEEKLESTAERVIRVFKQGHISRVV